MTPDDLFNVLLAIIAGGAIGLEREFRDKAAGFRTMIFICLGSALFTIVSLKLAGPGADPTRIASNVVSGVGFLGAGVILRNGGRVVGLTTAAAVWLVAAIGMAIATSQHGLAILVTVVTLLILWAFPVLERWVDSIRDERDYEIVVPLAGDKAGTLDRLFRESGLRIVKRRQAKIGGRVTCSWKVVGPPRLHDQVARQLRDDADVEELRY
jgi:putative Mg2+ transporter-C (MgtC) family protein